MFLAPALLGFLALASAPVIIHLLNRRQFERVEWAPMRVLKLTIRRNRRKVQLEHWLLLAIRTLAVAALIVAIARPLSSGRTVTGLFELPGRAARVLLIDDSMSMALEAGGTTPWASAIDAAGEVLEQAGSGDEVSIVLASGGEPLVRQASLETAQAALATLKSIEPSDRTVDWAEALGRAERLLEGSSLNVQSAALVTDAQDVGWSAEVSNIAGRWAEADRTLALIDVQVPRTGNAWIEAIEQNDPIVLAGSPALVSSVVETQRDAAATDEQATLRIDDREETLRLPELPAAGTVRVPLTRTFTGEGWRRLELQLPPDAQPRDNQSFAVVEVRPELTVVLVDGDVRSGPFQSETDFLALALAAGYNRVNLRRLQPADWAIEPIREADLLVLANVADVPADRVANLEQLVRGGAGLMVFPGDTVDPESFSAALYRDGEGVLPGRYGESQAAEFAGLTVTQRSDSPLQALSRLAPTAFADIRPLRTFPLEVDESSTATVLARWNDAEETPAVLSQRFGKGTVLQWSIAADRDGSNWPTQPSFVLAMRSAALSLARPTGVVANLVAGEPFELAFADGERGETVEASRLQSEQPIEVRLLDDRTRLQMTETRRAGFYNVTWTLANGTSRQQWVAVRPDARESSSATLSRDDLVKQFAALSPTYVSFAAAKTGPTEEATELWPYAVGAMLALLLADTLLSTWVDRRRRPSRASETPSASHSGRVAA